MIKNVTVNTQEINMSYLQECLEKKFSNSIYNMTRNGNVILFSYKRDNDSNWTNFTIEVKQPVFFIYDEDGNLQVYGTPGVLAYDIPADNFESEITDACYELANILE